MSTLLPAATVLRHAPDQRAIGTGAGLAAETDSRTALPAAAGHSVAADFGEATAGPRQALTGDQSKALDDLLAAASSRVADSTSAANGESAPLSIDDKLKTLEDSLARLRQSLGSATYGSAPIASAGLAVQRLA